MVQCICEGGAKEIPKVLRRRDGPFYTAQPAAGVALRAIRIVVTLIRHGRKASCCDVIEHGPHVSITHAAIPLSIPIHEMEYT